MLRYLVSRKLLDVLKVHFSEAIAQYSTDLLPSYLTLNRGCGIRAYTWKTGVCSRKLMGVAGKSGRGRLLFHGCPGLLLAKLGNYSHCH